MNSIEDFIYRLFPSTLIDFLEKRPLTKRILQNSGWFFFGRIAQKAIGFVFSIFIVRYLGPTRYGKLSYILSFVGLLNSFTKLGLPGVAIREIVRSKEDANEILGTTLFLRSIGAIFLLIIAPLIMYFALRPGNNLFFGMAIMVSLGWFVSAGDTIRIWFRAIVEEKWAVLSRVLSSLFSNIYKITLALTAASLFFFSMTKIITSTVLVVGLVIAYTKYGKSIKNWTISWQRAKALLSDSWPLLFAGFLSSVFMNIDKIMLGNLANDQIVGQYSLAVKLTSVLYLFAMAINRSSQPPITEAKEEDQKRYKKMLTKLLDRLALSGYILIIPISVLAPFFVPLIFGQEYSMAGGILVVHVFAALFLFIGLPRGTFILAEDFTIFGLIANISGAVTNVLLNIFFIPKFGGYGAAYATLISYFVVYIFVNAFSKQTQGFFKLQIRAIILLDWWKKLYNYIRE